MTLSVGSLFSGVGGIDLACERAGMRVLWQCEIDSQCRKVLRHHWPKTRIYEDVRSLTHRTPATDVLAGGFPCQDLSVAGGRAGLAGERSGLWWEFRRLLAELTPRWVLIENVPGLLSSDGGRDMGTLLGSLGQLGYWWAYRVLDAQWFGVPQRRRRVFIVGHSGDRRAPATVLFEPESLCRDTPPVRAAREEPSSPSRDGAANCCIVSGCGKRIKAKSLCANHYERQRTRGTLAPYEWPKPGACSVDGCGRTAKARGLCNTHYQRLRTRGDIRADQPIVASAGIEERFWGKVIQTDTCWLWDAAINEHGYGIFYDDTQARTVRAHRWAYEVCVGPIPDGLHLDHLCKVKRCVRPDHLDPVTSAENTRRFYDGDMPQVAGTLGGGAGKRGWADDTDRMTFVAFDTTQITSAANYSNPKPGDPCHPLAAGAHAPSIVPLLEVGARTNGDGYRDGDGIGEPGDPMYALQASKQHGIAAGLAVRRLTPLECTRLQGFPDSWLDIPGLSDSAKYRMLGNSVAVPCVEWITRRMAAYEEVSS